MTSLLEEERARLKTLKGEYLRLEGECELLNLRIESCENNIKNLEVKQ